MAKKENALKVTKIVHCSWILAEKCLLCVQQKSAFSTALNGIDRPASGSMQPQSDLYRAGPDQRAEGVHCNRGGQQLSPHARRSSELILVKERS